MYLGVFHKYNTILNNYLILHCTDFDVVFSGLFLYVFLSCFRNSCSFRFAMYSSFLVAVGKPLKFSCFNVKSRVTKSFSKVDFLSFSSHSTWKTTKKKFHDFGENFYILITLLLFIWGLVQCSTLCITAISWEYWVIF